MSTISIIPFAEFAKAVVPDGAVNRLPQIGSGMEVLTYSVFMNGPAAKDIPFDSQESHYQDVMLHPLTEKLGLNPEVFRDNMKVAELVAIRFAWMAAVLDSSLQRDQQGSLVVNSPEIVHDYELLTDGLNHPWIQEQIMLSEAMDKTLPEDSPENSMARAIFPALVDTAKPDSHDAVVPPYSRPLKLLGGKFVGNDKGEYCRAGEKNIVLIDVDEKIKFKDRKFDTFQAGAELAKAKGWEAIEVTGTERFRREAWFYAKLHGLEVVGFTPNTKDIERLADAEKEKRERVPNTPIDAARMASLKEAENVVLQRAGGVQKDERGDSRCIGPVVFQNGEYAVQNVGREVYRIHDKHKLDDKCLHKLVSDKVVEIKYERGMGTVNDLARKRGLGR